MLISILVPVYNASNYLKDQICSLLNQTYLDFEIIFVDDFSTDNTEDIILNFIEKYPRIYLYKNEFNKGLTGALNTGLKYCKGEYIARADGDDITFSNRLEKQIQFLLNNPNILILGSSSIIFSEVTSKTRKSSYPENPIELCWKFIGNNYFCHPSVMFNKDILKFVPKYPDFFVEDFAFFSECLKYVMGSNLNEPLIKYRESSTNFSNSNKNRINNMVKERYESNFRYYSGSDKLINEFYIFQSLGRLKLKNFLKIGVLNVLIVNKIRKQYSLKWRDYNVWRFILKLFLYQIISLKNDKYIMIKEKLRSSIIGFKNFI